MGRGHFKQFVFIALAGIILLMAALQCGPEPGTKETSKKLRVVAIFATPLEEPWDHAIHQALQRAEKELQIDYTFTDNIAATQFEKTIRNYAEADPPYDVIFGDAFAAEEIVRRVATDYPKIKFVFGSGLGASEPNLSVFDNWIHEPAYLSGMIAGRLTKSGTIGVVGAFPIPEVNRLINAFAAGARETQPNVKVKVTFIGSFFDPPKAKTATSVLMAQGADVFYAERAGVIEACAERGIPAIGNMVDQHNIAKDTVVTSVMWDMWPTVKYVIESASRNDFHAQNLADWSMMAKGGAKLAPYYGWESKLDKATQDLIARRSDEILTGRFRAPVIESVPMSD